MAPDLLLVGPGAAVFALGALLLGGSFAFPEGVDVGSLRWQPVFFSGIALVVGLQAVLAGAVLAHHSTIAVPGAQRRFAWVGRPDLPIRALATGVAMALAGLALNLVLLVRWLGGDEAPTGRGYGLAALSQSLIILGGTVASFGVVTRFLTSRRGLLPAGSRRGDAGRTATSPAAGRAQDLSATPRR
jgi:hypothetical protein